MLERVPAVVVVSFDCGEVFDEVRLFRGRGVVTDRVITGADSRTFRPLSGGSGSSASNWPGTGSGGLSDTGSDLPMGDIGMGTTVLWISSSMIVGDGSSFGSITPLVRFAIEETLGRVNLATGEFLIGLAVVQLDRGIGRVFSFVDAVRAAVADVLVRWAGIGG